MLVLGQLNVMKSLETGEHVVDIAQVVELDATGSEDEQQLVGEAVEDALLQAVGHEGPAQPYCAVNIVPTRPHPVMDDVINGVSADNDEAETKQALFVHVHVTVAKRRAASAGEVSSSIGKMPLFTMPCRVVLPASEISITLAVIILMVSSTLFCFSSSSSTAPGVARREHSITTVSVATVMLSSPRDTSLVSR